MRFFSFLPVSCYTFGRSNVERMKDMTQEQEKATTLLYIMDVTGDTRLHFNWDPQNEAEKQEMKQMFLDLQYKGYMIFECQKILGLFPKKGAELTEFDPTKSKWITEVSKLKQVEVKQITSRESEATTDAEMIDPEKHDISPNKKYIAAPAIAGG